MPKLRKSDTEISNRLLVATIQKYRLLNDVTPQEMAVSMRVCEATMYSRLKRPDRLTLGELRKLRKKLNIPKEELMQVI